MELTCTGRGVHVTDEMRESAVRKLSRVERLEARATRLEVEIIVEKNPRLAHLKRLEAALYTPRKTYRAHGQDPEFENALDEVVERLERQVRDHHEKRRTKVLSGARSVAKGNALESAHESEAPADTSE
ncbi:MAG TPA: ribosome-associated translation inhibitor RaiA [Actinomycetota bacterium]|jgi:putative sigma-54 modulation protein|nr:ribosome-associated translation inhibitor RaiA [Actinomycetota bacterium]